MELALEELESGLRIDKNELDVLCEDHADLFYEVSKCHDRAVEKRDQLALDIKDCEAKLDSEIRAKAKEEGEKITEKVVSSRIEQTEEYKKLSDEYLKSKSEVNRWSTLAQAYMQRSSMLKRLVELYQSEYYSRSDKTQLMEKGKDFTYKKLRSKGEERKK